MIARADCAKTIQEEMKMRESKLRNDRQKELHLQKIKVLNLVDLRWQNQKIGMKFLKNGSRAK